ncbi:MAG: divalent-cation tolerance protein CutA [Acidobacteria bacterium]|nr:divalent-cation tolerance protein CutA [Acidobacteriota bacterium]
MTCPIVIMTTTGSEQQALTIAEELMQQELVACVNILPTMRSIYRFKGKVFDDEENLLLIKTSDDMFDAVSEVIVQLHTYEVPEIVSFKVDQYRSSVLDWIISSIGGASNQT